MKEKNAGNGRREGKKGGNNAKGADKNAGQCGDMQKKERRKIIL